MSLLIHNCAPGLCSSYWRTCYPTLRRVHSRVFLVASSNSASGQSDKRSFRSREDGKTKICSIMAAQPNKLKLLCLHGYLQNSEVFRSKIGSMRKALKSLLEFEFVEGPYEATAGPLGNATEEQGLETGGKSWWQWSDVGPDGRPSRATHYSGWEPALELLVEAIKQHRPDGILGFSQGAAATALLLSCLSKADLEGVPPPKFAIMIAGFLPRDPAFADLVLSARPSVPSLFVYGTSDALVPPDRSKQLIEAFDPACTTVYEHSGAHLVPTCSGAFKAALAGFVDRFAAAASSVESGAAELGQAEQAATVEMVAA